MKKILLASLLTLSSGLAQADAISLNKCNVDLNGQFSVQNNTMQIGLNDDQQLTISPSGTFSINGQSILLTQEQQRWAEGYQQSLAAAAPMAAELAVEAVAVAKYAVDQVIQTLLGDGYSNPDLNDKLDALGERVKARFYAEDGSVRIQSASLQHDLENDQFSEELQELIQQTVQQSIGRLLLVLGSEMLSSAGDDKSFETKMDNIAADLEQQIEAKADNLEQTATSLCQLLKQADGYEEKLNSNLASLRSLNLLSAANR